MCICIYIYIRFVDSRLPGKSLWMGPGIPPLKLKMMLESNPLESRILVRRLAAKSDLRISIWESRPNLSRACLGQDKPRLRGLSP